MATKRELNDSDTISSSKHLRKEKQFSHLPLCSSDEYYIYWFDDLHSNPLEYYNIDRSKLRALIDYLEIFQQFEQFERSIHQNSKTKLFIILNFSSIEKVYSFLNDSKYISSIYIYRDNMSTDQQLINQYQSRVHAKVKFNQYDIFYS